MGKRTVCATLDEELIKEMERIREESGMSVSRQIELRLKGYELVKIMTEPINSFNNLDDYDVTVRFTGDNEYCVCCKKRKPGRFVIFYIDGKEKPHFTICMECLENES